MRVIENYEGMTQEGRDILYEITRKNLVGKTKYQSPERYARRKNYHVSNRYEIDVDSFINDDYIAIKCHVGDYDVVVAFSGVLETLIDLCQRKTHNNLTHQDTYMALYKAIDNGDVQVDCACGDYRYRFKYWASKLGYQYGGNVEKRPAHITNPRNNLGSFCKHLTLTLGNKSWLKRCANVVNSVIKDNLEEIREVWGLNEDELIANNPKAFLKQYQQKKDTDAQQDNTTNTEEPTQDENTAEETQTNNEEDNAENTENSEEETEQ